MVRVVKAEINSPLDDYRKSIIGCHGKFLCPLPYVTFLLLTEMAVLLILNTSLRVTL
jgi:hypothetical protein